MFSRIGYAVRETWASFRRNLTLTAAAILTSAVSLLLVGTTFLIQRAFENLLVQWRGDVEMIVFVRSDASAEQITLIDSVLRASPTIIDVSKLTYLNKSESYEEAKRIFVGDPVTLSLLTPESITTNLKLYLFLAIRRSFVRLAISIEHFLWSKQLLWQKTSFR